MTRIKQTIDINARPGQVFRFVQNAENLPEYLPVTHVDIIESDRQRTKARHDWTAGGRTREVLSVARVIENGRKLRYTTFEGSPWRPPCYCRTRREARR